MDFRILGPLEVRDDQGRRVELGARQQRLVLAALLLHPGEVVSVDRLIEVLWGERAPGSAVKSVQVHVSRLRKTLERDGRTLVHTRPGGYLIELAPGELDSYRFAQLVEEGRRALAESDPETASATLRSADALWSGSALSDFAYEPFAQDEINRLNELRLGALEDRLEADLALGRHGEVMPELQQLVARHPMRERLRGQLMVALHRAGRKAEALAAYDEGRRTFAEELGLEPGAHLRGLQRAILNDDPELAAPPPETPQARASQPVLAGRSGWLLAVGGVLLATAAAAVATVLATRGGASAAIEAVAPNSLAAIDPETRRIVATIPAVAGPSTVVFAQDDLWVANVDDATVQRVDLETAQVVNAIPTGTAPIGLAAGHGAVWAIGADGVVLRIDPLFNKIVTRTPTVEAGSLLHGAPVAGALTTTGDSVWALSGGSFSAPRLSRIAPAQTRRAREVLALGDGPTALAAGFGHLWAADSFDNTVTRIDQSGVVIATIPVGHGARAIAVGEEAVWVAYSLDDAVARIDPETNSVTTTIPVGQFPTAIAIGAGAVWVANRNDGTVSRIDPTSNAAETIPVGASPAGIAFAAGSVWFTTQENPPAPVPSRGDVLRVSTSEDVGTDPAHATLPQVTYASCAKLLNYPDARGPNGARLVPEVAAAMPAVSPDGRTYTFTIRDGFAFSLPRHEHVTADTFKHTIERSLSPRTGVGPALFVSDIVGVDAYRAGKTEHISGVVAQGNTLTIRLVAPDPSFLHRIALPSFCAVPLGTPAGPDPLPAIPSAGPYYVASELPHRRIVLRRNPSYHGSRPRRPREIHVTLGAKASTSIDDVLAGRADFALVNPPARRDPELLARYGPASPAARAGRQQYFVEPTLQFAFLWLNTDRPLFADVRLRKAVNYAIDRRALARLGSWVSGPFQSIPMQQYLPPTLPGAARSVLYPPRGDLRAARGLAPDAAGTAVVYTCSDEPRICRRAAELVKANLAPLGVDVDIKEFPYPEQFVRAQTKGEPYDILISHWGLDYPDPANVLNNLLSAGDVSPALAGALDRAARLTGRERESAYRSLSLEIAREAAPWVPYAVGSSRDLFSARIGCQVFQPVYGMDLGALCTRS